MKYVVDAREAAVAQVQLVRHMAYAADYAKRTDKASSQLACRHQEAQVPC